MAERVNPTLPQGRALALAAACVLSAFFLAILGQVILGTAMPAIVEDLGGFDRYAWAATSSLVASVIAIPVSASLSDLYGRRAIFVAGIAVFLAGSVLAALSQSVLQLTGCAAILGAGAGGLMSLSYVAVGDLFPPEARGKYIGYLGAMFGLAALAGLFLGGYISEFMTWRAIFVLNVACGLPVLLLALRFPQLDLATDSAAPDYPGMAALTLAIVPILVALSWAGAQYEWSSWQVIAPLAFGGL